MKKYDHQKNEKYWQKKWLDEKIYEPNLKDPRGKGKFYNLMMFPYPSAEGLHVGNMYAFTGSDIYGRFKRMQGFDVFEPIGLDGFGIHSENYAIKVGEHPADQVRISQKNFYKQLQMIGNAYAWDESLETYDPEYYKWTQWLFVQMFKHGLAYRKKQPVNWCPSCKTVLADEQVIAGECERCGSKVIKKELEQWFFKITDYAEKLLNNLDTIDWSEKIKIAQRNWIGKKKGIEITYPIEGINENIKVFTTRPDTNFGATFVVVAPENELALKITLPENKQAVSDYIEKTKNKTEEERIQDGRKKTGVFTGRYAINHLTEYKMPIWVGDFVLSSFGTGVVVGVPGHDIRDFEFAREFNLEIKRVVVGKDEDASDITKPEQVQEKEGTMINSDFLNGMDIHNATRKIMDHIEKNNWGKKITQYRLRDWLISRQRYWGPPIPMINCDKCGWQPVSEEDLPVLLPKVKDFRPTGTDKSPLAAVEKFVNTKCPVCGGPARRETDVSDTFLDSAWYYLQYPSDGFEKGPFDAQITKTWLPVDMYIGGAEHAVLHLLYIRFVAHALHDWKMVDFEEPITKFRAHGLIIKDGAKMSKSKGNIVNPDEYVKNYGADALRMYLMFLGPFEQGGDFRDEGISGITRFLAKVWNLLSQVFRSGEAVEKRLNQSIKKISEDIEKIHYNTAISELMILIREMEENGFSQKQLETFLKLLAPFAPHITEEIWRNILKQDKSIHIEPWPSFDPALISEDVVSFAVQVKGKTRGIIEMPAESTQEEIENAAKADENVAKYLGNQTVKKIIFVPKRLINFVL